MQALSIPNGYFQLWYLYLQQQQIDYRQEPLFQPYLTQLEQVLAAPLDGQSNYLFFAEVMQLTKTVLQCPQLVFELAKLIRPHHFGVLGYMATRSESVADALHHVIRFSRLVIDGAEIVPLQLLQTGHVLQLVWPLHAEKYALLNEMTMACMVHLARQIFPLAQFNLRKVSFAHEAQMALYHYQKFYACTVEFKQAHYSFMIEANDLACKSTFSDPSLMQLLLKQAEDAIAAKPAVDDTFNHIRREIADYLRQHQKAPKIEYLATQLGMSMRSLQRYLAQHQSSFKQLLEDERIKLSEQLLAQNIPLYEIAMMLGYSDQSALARAYKAATGQTLLKRKHQLKQ